MQTMLDQIIEAAIKACNHERNKFQTIHPKYLLAICHYETNNFAQYEVGLSKVGEIPGIRAETALIRGMVGSAPLFLGNKRPLPSGPSTYSIDGTLREIFSLNLGLPQLTFYELVTTSPTFDIPQKHTNRMLVEYLKRFDLQMISLIDYLNDAIKRFTAVNPDLQSLSILSLYLNITTRGWIKTIEERTVYGGHPDVIKLHELTDKYEIQIAEFQQRGLQEHGSLQGFNWAK